MDFVVSSCKLFSMSREKATQVMLQVQREGWSVWRSRARGATAKVEQVHHRTQYSTLAVHDGGD